MIAPIISTTFRETIKFAPIINGSNEGIKILTHIFMPLLADDMASFGKITIPIISINTTSFGKKYFVNLDMFIKSPI